MVSPSLHPTVLQKHPASAAVRRLFSTRWLWVLIPPRYGCASHFGTSERLWRKQNAPSISPADSCSSISSDLRDETTWDIYRIHVTTGIASKMGNKLGLWMTQAVVTKILVLGSWVLIRNSQSYGENGFSRVSFLRPQIRPLQTFHLVKDLQMSRLTLKICRNFAVLMSRLTFWESFRVPSWFIGNLPVHDHA